VYGIVFFNHFSFICTACTIFHNKYNNISAAQTIEYSKLLVTFIQFHIYKNIEITSYEVTTRESELIFDLHNLECAHDYGDRRHNRTY